MPSDDAVHGHISAIARKVEGDELAVDHASAATTLLVNDTADFDELGGQVLVNDVVYDYTGIANEDLGSAPAVLLATGLTAAATAGDRVDVYDPGTAEVVASWEADVVDDVDDSTLVATVSHGLVSLLGEGIYGLMGTSVVCELESDGEWYVTQPLGKTPIVDLSFADPGTIPDPVATDPPPSSPAVTLSGFAGGIVARAETVAASVQIEYHVWDSTTGDETYVPTQGDPATVLDTTRSAVEVIERLPDGSPLVEGTAYYVATWAKNSAGYAPTPSATVSGQMDMSAVRGLVVAEMVAGVIFSGRYETGSSSWDADEGLVFRDENGVPFITLPADGTASAEIYAFIRASGATFEGNVNFYELTQLFGIFRMANGITDPQKKAQFSRTWASKAITLGLPTQHHGLTDDSAGTSWVTVFSFFGAGVTKINKTTGAVTDMGTVGSWQTDFQPDGGITRMGSFYYVLGQDFARAQDWYVYKLDSAFAKVAEFPAAGIGTKRPAIGNDGTDLIVAWSRNNGTEIRVRPYSTSGTPGTDIDCGTSLTAQWDLGGVYKGNADFGVPRIVVMPETRDPLAFVWTGSTGVRQLPHEFPRASASNVRGMHWDGTRFRHLDDAGRIWDYETGHVTTSTVYGAYTWYDGDTSSGSVVHETAKSPEETFGWPARSKLVVTAQPAPDVAVTDPTKLDKANLVRIWVGTVSGTTRLQSGAGVNGALLLGVTSLTIATLNTGSTSATAASFASASVSPGSVESAANNGTKPHTQLQGDGSVRIAKAMQHGLFSFGTFPGTGVANTLTTPVTFDVPFDATPIIQVSTPGDTGPRECWASAISATGFTLNAYRNSGTAGYNVHWSAFAQTQ